MSSIDVTEKDILDLLNLFEVKPYDASTRSDDGPEIEIMKKCEELFRLDYSISVLENNGGCMSTRYPERILIPENERSNVVGRMRGRANLFGTSLSSSNDMPIDNPSNTTANNTSNNTVTTTNIANSGSISPNGNTTTTTTARVTYSLSKSPGKFKTITQTSNKNTSPAKSTQTITTTTTNHSPNNSVSSSTGNRRISTDSPLKISPTMGQLKLSNSPSSASNTKLSSQASNLSPGKVLKSNNKNMLKGFTTTTVEHTNMDISPDKETNGSTTPTITTSTKEEISSNGTNGNSKNGFNSRLTQSIQRQKDAEQQSPNTISSQSQQQQQQQQSQQQTQQQSQQQHHTIYEDVCDINKLRECIPRARYARCRQRFIVPAILYRGKYICRSATISVLPETYGRKVADFAYRFMMGGPNSNTVNIERSEEFEELVDQSDDEEKENIENNDPNEDLSLKSLQQQTPPPFSYPEVIRSDVQALEALNIGTIMDLMVEKCKIKYFMTVSSSEKADPDNHYENFSLLTLPYPGCEFFKTFHDYNYVAKNLHYDWKQSFNDAEISLPTGPATELDINWNDYRQWDLVEITQNYLKAALKYIQDDNSGLLVHCISGWDRTPLFIAMIRLSLWADGLVHQSLSATQITYLTLAYDWYLFGHQLPDRIRKDEDIMFFCYHMLKHIADEEYSVVEHRRRTKTCSSSSSSVIILKTDCDDIEETDRERDMLMNFLDQDSNESTTPANTANCDTNINIMDHFFILPSTNTTTNASSNSPSTTTTTPNSGIGMAANRSPNTKRTRTSPISVPGSSSLRQRSESTSSLSGWHVVTETGSLDSVKNGSFMLISKEECPSPGGTADVEANVPNYVVRRSGGKKVPPTLRKRRLNAVRALFINTYGKAIGLKYREGTSLSFFSTLADQIL